MNDLEMIEMCALAMKLEVHAYRGNHIRDYWRIHNANGTSTPYSPLTNAAQCLDLIEAFNLVILRQRGMWAVGPYDSIKELAENSDLKRAVVMCVAITKMTERRGA